MVEVKYMEEYDYIPSIPAAVTFIVLFGILTLLHCWQMFRGRTWFFTAFIFGGICEYQLSVPTCCRASLRAIFRVFLTQVFFS